MGLRRAWRHRRFRRSPLPPDPAAPVGGALQAAVPGTQQMFAMAALETRLAVVGAVQLIAVLAFALAPAGAERDGTGQPDSGKEEASREGLHRCLVC